MKYVALLRGINVGGNNKVSMSELKILFEELGFSDVTTYLNSGNVIFSSNKAPSTATLARHIEQTFGFPVPLIVITGEQIKNIANQIPEVWLNDRNQKTDVLYLFPEIDSPDIIPQIGVKPEIETFIYHPGALLCNISRANQTQGSVQKLIGSKLYKCMTARNVNTARKLAELVG